jgi:POT family proton-dependent oligopeptide transporter
MTYFCLFNLSPIALAIISDQFWGKYKTICVTSFIYLLGLIILVVTSIPISITRGIGLPGLICAMILLGIAGGGFRTMIGPFIAEQYTRKTLVVKGSNIYFFN